MQRQVKAKSLSVKIHKNEPTTVRLNCLLANEEFLTLEIPRYALERFMVQAKRAIEEAPLLSRRRSSGCMSSEHFGQLAWQFERMSGSSGLKVQAAIAC